MTPTLRRKTRGRTLAGAAVFASFLTLPWAALGQATATTAGAPATSGDSAVKPDDSGEKKAESDVVLLPEFRVDSSKDTGYLATNATSGTRLNMPVRELPMHLEVITRDLIEDMGAVSFKEALVYNAGVSQDILQTRHPSLGSADVMFSPSGTGQQNNTLRPDGTALNIRGYNNRFTLRNGFRMDFVTDVINIGRQEVIRGPQALLYGVGAIGGIVNIGPRYPNPDGEYIARVGYGSEDFRRAEVYLSDQLWKKGASWVNYGVGAVYQKTSDYTDFNDREVRLVTPALDIRFSDKVSLFIDAEFGTIETSGNGFQDITDASASALRNEYGLTYNNVNVYNEPIQTARDRFDKGKEFRWSGPDPLTKDNYSNVTFDLNWKTTDQLQFNIGLNFVEVDKDILAISGQGTQVTSAASRPTTPGLWTDAGPNPANAAQRLWKYHVYSWNRSNQELKTLGVRAEANYTFEFLGGKQSILVGWVDQEIHNTTLSTLQATRNDGSTGTQSWIPYGSLDYIRYAGEMVRPNREEEFWEWNAGYYAIYNGHFLDDRLNAFAGWRRDRFMIRGNLVRTYTKANSALPDSDLANWVRPRLPDYNSLMSAPGELIKINGYSWGGKTRHEDSPFLGLSYAVTKDINVYAVTGVGIYPNRGQRDGLNNPFDAERTTGTDLGVKLDLWKNDSDTPRVSVQLGLFKIKRENAVFNFFWAPLPRLNNQPTLRSGYTGSVLVRGPGENGYEVMNSGYTTFQRNQPVTYLLPIQYVAEADRTHPRVTGAPQRNNLLLVDYASLGSAETDPLRRAMDAAISDPAWPTALGSNQRTDAANVAAGLWANNAYINRSSGISGEDESSGVDLSVILNLSKSYTAVFTYTYLDQQLTGGFQTVDQPNSTEYDSWWNYMGIPLEQRRANLDESSYNWLSSAFGPSGIGLRTVDQPEHQIGMWNKYSIRNGLFKDLDFGLGLNWRSERQSETILGGGLQSLADGRENIRFRPPYPEDVKVNAAIGYTRKFGDRRVRLQLNVNNVLDDQKDEVFSTSRLYINPANGNTVSSTTVGAVAIDVPERVRLYHAPRSFRLTATVAF